MRDYDSGWHARAIALLFALSVLMPEAQGSENAESFPFGPQVYLFNPGMPLQQIQKTVDRIAAAQTDKEFGADRYAILFAPGTYGSRDHPLSLKVGYYTSVAGLGRSPADVVINGTIQVRNRCVQGTCLALDNFWRSLSNLTINISTVDNNCLSDQTWAASQAAPIRRLQVLGGDFKLFDACSQPGYSSGGFISDSQFAGAVVNGSQQQYLIRNSRFTHYSNGVWNQVFVGVFGAPNGCDVADTACAYTTISRTPRSREAPFLVAVPTGGYGVFVPDVQNESAGPSWADHPTPGTLIPLSKFFIAKPTDGAMRINTELAGGRHLLLEPGVYHLDQTLRVSHPGTVVMGLGFATLLPEHGQTALEVRASHGVNLSELLIEAGAQESPDLVRIDDAGGSPDSRQDPTAVHDVFFRVGGPHVGRARTSLVVAADDVILDHVWAWRADHGAGTGWMQNTADTGVVVHGRGVIAYGLFVEHYQRQEVLWDGEDGTVIFFQNEMPYDAPTQDAWRETAQTEGYPALEVASGVKRFRGVGLGSYSYFNQGQRVFASQAFRGAPASRAREPRECVHDLSVARRIRRHSTRRQRNRRRIHHRQRRHRRQSGALSRALRPQNMNKKRQGFRPTMLCLLMVAPAALAAGPASPWLDATRTPEARALLVLKAMTLEEKLALLHGPMALPLAGVPIDQSPRPAGAPWSAGFIPGIPRLGVPPLFETDASLGVVNPLGIRPGDVATAMPAGLALAATFSPELAYQSGATIGSEAHAKGFNVLLGGGMDLTRDPRAGRNFEYLGEDPLLAGVMAGEAIRGTQDQHVISTAKHFALNANETNRNSLDARIDKAALRESDLLAFQIAIEHGHPGSIMCAYNKINGDYSCANPWLLNGVLKHDWGYPGWVMSDWGAVHGELDALQGLDQESGEQLDSRVFFGEPLTLALAAHRIPPARIDDMVYRILRAEFSSGLIEDPPAARPIDYAAHAHIALLVAQAGVVLLKNAPAILPLRADIQRIAVIGGQAQVGVFSGGGSSQVTPSNGSIRVPIGGNGGMSHYRDALYFAPSPVAVLRQALPHAAVRYDSGDFPEDAAALAAKSDVALVFVTRHEMEGYDVPNLRLPHGQDALVAAVAAANPHTIVILETGNPVEMPWLSKIAGLLAAWYPGQEGAQAITDVLTGKVNPSGRLPISFPESESQLPRSQLPNFGVEEGVAVSIDYTEGADVGYRWYARRGIRPLFSFGFGLSYTRFAYENFKIEGGNTLTISFDVVNTGTRAGADVPQVYLTSTPTGPDLRLIGFSRVQLQAGERHPIRLSVDRRLLAHYDEDRHLWRLPAGTYAAQIGTSATQLGTRQSAPLKGAAFADR